MDSSRAGVTCRGERIFVLQDQQYKLLITCLLIMDSIAKRKVPKTNTKENTNSSEK